MEDPDFSNREIREMFNDVTRTLERIEGQTIRTNGRVTKLEQWRYVSMGAVGVLTTMVVPLLVWALYTLVNINESIHKSIDQALSAYEITKEPQN